jgi:glycosyltransferase involved in cell wall biosynthesis
MRIVILSETFAKDMGYLGSMLPKYLARLRMDVHVIAMDLMPYYQREDFRETYERIASSKELVPGYMKEIDGYTLHIVRHRKVLGYMKMQGMFEKLNALRPNVVYSMAAIGWIPLDAAFYKLLLGYKLFTGSHTTASSFPLAKRRAHLWDRERIKCLITRAVPGRLVSLVSEKCYVPTSDCAEIAWRFFGVQRHKVKVMHLGVDTDFFRPVVSKADEKERKSLREQLGFEEDDIVCIYTGKMTEDKNALLLAQAVDKLRSLGVPFRGLFIGEGMQKGELMKSKVSEVLNFMPYYKLPAYYRASDIAIWPTNESTSMLDAAACGIPIIVSDGIFYREHVNGNGLVYRMNDLDDLVNKLQSLRDSLERKRLGEAGAEKMAKYFSWQSVAKRRLKDFAASSNACS